MESKEKVDQDIDAKTKKDEDDKLNVHGKSEKNDEFMSRPSSQQSKAKEDEENLSNGNSQFSSEEKSPISKANLTEDQIKTCNSPSRVDLEEKGQYIEIKPRGINKEKETKLKEVGTSKETHKSSSKEVGASKETHKPSSKEVGTSKETHKPSSKEVGASKETHKSSSKEVGTSKETHQSSSKEVGTSKETHQSSPKEVGKSFGTSKETHESSSKEAKAKTALHPKLTTLNKKPSTTLVCNRNEEDITSSKVKTSTNSTRVKLGEKTQHVRTEANHNSQVHRAEKDPTEHVPRELELNHTTVTVREVKDPQDSSEEVRNEFRKEEAVCKKCFKDMCGEPTVLKAKCNCKLSLIHEKCQIEWSDEMGSTCLVCGKQIEYVGVEVTLITDASTSSSQHNNVDQPETPPSWCCCWF